jgi:hypothetical protein
VTIFAHFQRRRVSPATVHGPDDIRNRSHCGIKLYKCLCLLHPIYTHLSTEAAELSIFYLLVHMLKKLCTAVLISCKLL